MAGSKKRHGAKAGAKKETLTIPGAIPATALFVNFTVLTNKLIKEGCSITVSSVMRMTYLFLGVLIGVSAIVFRILFEIPTLAVVLVLLVGLITVWQGSHLPAESARAIISRLNKGDGSERERYLWADDTGVGVYVKGASRTFEWDAVKLAVATEKVTCLVLKANSVLLVLDNEGFLKGTVHGFQDLLAAHVTKSEKNAFVAWCDKTVYRLDHWKQLYGKRGKHK